VKGGASPPPCPDFEDLKPLRIGLCGHGSLQGGPQRLGDQQSDGRGRDGQRQPAEPTASIPAPGKDGKGCAPPEEAGRHDVRAAVGVNRQAPLAGPQAGERLLRRVGDGLRAGIAEKEEAARIRAPDQGRPWLARAQKVNRGVLQRMIPSQTGYRGTFEEAFGHESGSLPVRRIIACR